MTHISNAGEARSPTVELAQALRFQVWCIRDDTRTLVAAFVDYLDAHEYAAEYINGDFTRSEVVSL